MGNQEIVLVKISEIQKDESNPRHRSKERFEALKISLRKFGWLMPVYIDKDNFLYSGHQRIDAWKSLGYEEVPARVFNPDKIKSPIGLNMLFNLTTCDFGNRDTVSEEAFKDLNISEIVESMEDAKDLYPCLNCEKKTIESFGEIPFSKSWQGYRSMLTMKVHIPIIISSDGRVANGINRLYAYKRLGYKDCLVVHSEHTYDKISSVMNKISMDFSVEDTIGETLMVNSFSRNRNSGHRN